MNAAAHAPQSVRDSEKTKQAILRAAADVFADRGFDGARIAAIANLAEVPSGLLYHYFPSKRALFEAALSRAFEPYAGELSTLLANAEPRWEVLEQVVRRYFGWLRENPRLARMTGWWYASLGWVETPQPAHAIWSLKRGATSFVERLRQAGAIRRDVSAESVVLSVLALCQHWHISHGENLHLLRLEPGQDPHAVRLEQILEFTKRAIAP